MSSIQADQNVYLSNASVNYVAGNQFNINQAANARFDAKEGQPPRALFAAFDSNRDRTRCLEGTRTDILNEVFRWIGIKNARDGAPPDSQEKCIFWINGSPGTGKTTISYTVAEECRKCGILAASFFCSRDDSACSDPSLIFTTIAYQIGTFSPPFKAEVARVMMSQPDIGYASISYQLEQLIVNPLLSLTGSIHPCVVVVDALDECRDSRTPSIILSALSRFVPRLAPLKFLVTSRPENHIATAFRDRELALATRRFILHEIQLDRVQGDIESYLSLKLASIRDSYDISCEWPAIEDIRELARLSHGLFIFAATSVKFIDDPNDSDPQGQLADLLNSRSESNDESPYFHLYQLYTQVLDRTFPSISGRLSERLKKIIGSIVIIQEPLSPLALARLLGLELSTVRATLARLHSVIIVPEDDTRAIRLLHPSFFDFITNPLRCRNLKFVVNLEMQHTFLAHACLQAMKGLRQDLCEIKNPSILNREVDDLPARIEASILPHVQYACRHWASHVACATFSDDLASLMEEFCRKKLLNWLEVCSLLGELRSALLALNAAQKAVLTSNWNMPDTLHLLRDGERFTLEFFAIISTCSLQVYRSALLFTPKKTAIRKVYEELLDQSIQIYNAPNQTWRPCLRVMEGHSHCVNSVAFSADGTCIVSGSDDKTLRLWDAISCAQLVTLRGHYCTVNSVAFSPDGTRIVSGSDDGTLRLWDAVGGACLITLRGHSGSIASVAFSPDGTHIVSGSLDNTLRLWDAVGGAHLVTLKGHSSVVNSVAFSSNGNRIASGSYDKTLRLWDAINGAHLVTLSGHSSLVNSVAFSPDSTRIVSGSCDRTLRLWDAVSGAHLATRRGHSDFVNCVAFSPDGTRVVSGSDDKTLRLWDAFSDANSITLCGHSGSVHSFAFSPDGTRIVSGSYDKTLRLWDAIGGAHLVTLSGHSSLVNSVAFSPDSTRIVSGSYGRTLRLWDAVSGAHLATRRGHSDSVNCVAFSPDGTRIVSGSNDKTLRLWDAISGVHLVTLSGHSSFVNSVAFSPDSTRIVSGSYDKTLRLWDAVSGADPIILGRHSGSVNSVAFSPDGTRIVSGSDDKTLRLRDAVSGARLITLRGHSGNVVSVAFSPDGTRIVSGSWDKTLRLWDAVSGATLSTMQGYPIYISSLARSLGSSWTTFFQHNAIPSEPTCPIFSYMADDGWIYSMTLNQRICWVPPSFRPRALDATRDSVSFGTEDGRVVILCFNNMDNLC